MNTNEKIQELNEIIEQIKKAQEKENGMAVSSIDKIAVKEYKNKQTWGTYNITSRLIGCGILSGLAYFMVNLAAPIAKFFEYVPFWYIGMTALLFLYFSHGKSKESKNNKYSEMLETYSVEQESIKLLMNYNMKFTELNNQIKLITNEDKVVDILGEFKSTLQSSLATNNGKLKIKRFNRYVKSIFERHDTLAGYDIRKRSQEIVDTLESELRQKNNSNLADLNKEKTVTVSRNLGVLAERIWVENEPMEINSNKELSVSVKYLSKEERLAHANKIAEQPLSISASKNEKGKNVEISLVKQKEYAHEK